jgi:hypothetical protein
MDKSAQGCAERTTLGRGPVPLASIPEGDEYAEAFVIYTPSGKGKVAILFSQGSGWAATLG